MTQQNRHRPSRGLEFVLQAASNMVGTLAAALTLFLIATAVGTIHDVPTRLMLVAVVALVALVLGCLGAIWLSRELAEIREAVRIYDRVQRPMERCETALRESEKYTSDGVFRMLDASTAARIAGDPDESQRLLADALNAVASGKAALAEAKRRRDEAFAAVEASGFREWQAAGHRMRLGRAIAALTRHRLPFSRAA